MRRFEGCVLDFGVLKVKPLDIFVGIDVKVVDVESDATDDDRAQ
jgi:hypothetical protein